MNKLSNATVKTKEEIERMKRGGKKLKRVKKALEDYIKEGITAEGVNKFAEKLIKREGGKPSFKMVEGYKWASCVNINEGLVHGIPKKETRFKRGDIVSVDIGIYYDGFHTDTSFTVGIKPDDKTKKFLEVGKKALSEAIKRATSENRVYDISKAIEDTVRQAGYSPIKALVGHGIGKNLHEDPQIPCYVEGKRENSFQLRKNLVLAIEVMYALGSPEVELSSDGWTISTRDDKISALFEETVAVTSRGPYVLTGKN